MSLVRESYDCAVKRPPRIWQPILRFCGESLERRGSIKSGKSKKKSK